METILNQRDPKWANILLGTSKYYIHAYGCFITVLAEILGTTPDDVNTKLNAVSGFAADSTGELDEVIWSKVAEAFPGWMADFHTPYDNTQVVALLTAGNSVIVQVDAAPIGNPGGLHAVRYIGGGMLHDPWTGTIRPTSDFPNVKAFNVLTKVMLAATEPATPAQPIEPAQNPNMYKGLDLTNTDSMKAAIDTWKDVEDGVFVRKDSIQATPEAPVVTLSNLPPHEKEAVMNRIQNVSDEVKSLLGL